MARILTWSSLTALAVGIFVASWRESASQPAPVTVFRPAVTPVPELQPIPPVAMKADVVPRPEKPSPAPAVTSVSGDALSRDYTWDEMLRNLRELAAKDPEGALKQILQWPEGEKRDEALEKVCYGIADTDPSAALEVVQTFHLDQRAGDIMGDIVQQWAGADLASAYDWVGRQPAGEQHDDLLERVAYVYSQTDPAAAADLVVQEMSSGGTQIEAAMTVLHQWGLRDVAAAARWVETFPDGPLRERAVKELEGIQRYQRELAARS